MNEHPEDLSERLLSLADRQPRAPALCAAGRAPMSFGSLGERIERVRSRLRGWGFARGDVVAWPVDYRSRGPQDLWRFFDKPSEGLRRVDIIVREWLGLFTYWLGGSTSELYPGP